MIIRKSTFFLGIFIFIILKLGLPSSWETAFVMLSGLALIALSVKITLPKKTLKSKGRKEKITSVFVESVPTYPKENIVGGINALNSNTEMNVVENSADSE